MEYIIWKTKKGFVLTVFIYHGVINDACNVLLLPEEFSSIFLDLESVEKKAKAIAITGCNPRENISLEDYDKD